MRKMAIFRKKRQIPPPREIIYTLDGSSMSDLQKRWLTKDGKVRLSEIVSLASKGDGKEIEQTLGRIDGRLDLRGMKLKATATDKFNVNVEGRRYKVKLGELKLDSIELTGADFDYSIFENVIFKDCEYNDASFKSIKFIGWRDFGSIYKRSSFVGSSFTDFCCLGSHDNVTQRVTEYHDCDFSQSKMHKCSGTFPLFENCRFERVVIDDVNFDGSRFTDCVFSGKLQDVYFHGLYIAPKMEGYWQPPRKIFANPMKNVDFSHCSVDGLEFTVDIDLSSVILPNEDDHIFIWFPKRTFSRALELAKIETWGNLKASEKGMTLQEYFALNLENASRGTERRLEILNRKEAEDDGGPFFKTWVDIVEKCSESEAHYSKSS